MFLQWLSGILQLHKDIASYLNQIQEAHPKVRDEEKHQKTPTGVKDCKVKGRKRLRSSHSREVSNLSISMSPPLKKRRGVDRGVRPTPSEETVTSVRSAVSKGCGNVVVIPPLPPINDEIVTSTLAAVNRKATGHTSDVVRVDENDHQERDSGVSNLTSSCEHLATSSETDKKIVTNHTYTNECSQSCKDTSPAMCQFADAVSSLLPSSSSSSSPSKKFRFSPLESTTDHIATLPINFPSSLTNGTIASFASLAPSQTTPYSQSSSEMASATGQVPKTLPSSSTHSSSTFPASLNHFFGMHSSYAVPTDELSKRAASASTSDSAIAGCTTNLSPPSSSRFGHKALKAGIFSSLSGTSAFETPTEQPETSKADISRRFLMINLPKIDCIIEKEEKLQTHTNGIAKDLPMRKDFKTDIFKRLDQNTSPVLSISLSRQLGTKGLSPPNGILHSRNKNRRSETGDDNDGRKLKMSQLCQLWNANHQKSLIAPPHTSNYDARNCGGLPCTKCPEDDPIRGDAIPSSGKSAESSPVEKSTLNQCRRSFQKCRSFTEALSTTSPPRQHVALQVSVPLNHNKKPNHLQDCLNDSSTLLPKPSTLVPLEVVSAGLPLSTLSPLSHKTEGNERRVLAFMTFNSKGALKCISITTRTFKIGTGVS